MSVGAGAGGHNNLAELTITKENSELTCSTNRVNREQGNKTRRKTKRAL